MEIIVKWFSGYGKRYMNANAVSNVVHYIYRGALECSDRKRIYGSIGMINQSDPEKIIQEMMETKKIYNLTHGVQCKHMTVSLGKAPNLSRKKIIKKIRKMLHPFADKYQIFYGVHDNNILPGLENYHIHVMLNSIDMNRRRKISISPKEYQRFYDGVQKIWSTHWKVSAIWIVNIR